MARQRAPSSASTNSGSNAVKDQELGSMYDYLAKIILLGPSGCGKSCLLHRFVKNEWRILSSQTIGVEFASKIVRIGTRPHMKRIKLQLWDTAGTERFRSVSRSYYRGAAGAILVYDVSSHASFAALPNFLNDARALASPDLTVILAGNKTDVGDEDAHLDTEGGGMSLDNTPPPSSFSSRNSLPSTPSSNRQSMLGAQSTATAHDAFREVAPETASRWASSLPVPIPVAVEVSALSGEGVDELFHRLARIILTKIELGEIDPDDPASGIQYGDSGGYGGGVDDDGSVKSGNFGNEEGVRWRKGRNNRGGGGASRLTGMREWEEVFRLGPRRRGGNCC